MKSFKLFIENTNDIESFIGTIVSDFNEKTHRMVFADWLDDNNPEAQETSKILRMANYNIVECCSRTMYANENREPTGAYDRSDVPFTFSDAVAQGRKLKLKPYDWERLEQSGTPEKLIPAYTDDSVQQPFLSTEWEVNPQSRLSPFRRVQKHYRNSNDRTSLPGLYYYVLLRAIVA